MIEPHPVGYVPEDFGMYKKGIGSYAFFDGLLSKTNQLKKLLSNNFRLE